jgi:hypothetical protein
MAGSTNDQEDLLSLLNAHGQDFLSSFGNTERVLGKRKAEQLVEFDESEDGSSDHEEDTEEWGGILGSLDSEVDPSESRAYLNWGLY